MEGWLAGAGLEPRLVREVVARALEEDLGPGDVTTRAVVMEGRECQAELVAKAEGVVAGLPVAVEAFRQVDPAVQITLAVRDGHAVMYGQTLASVRGSARGVLGAERVALNFLQRLSGVATYTARMVKAVQGTGASILDTRKTTPGLRALEKYAVRVGGGRNHRCGLFDGVLIKDNHLALAGGVGAAVDLAKAHAPHGLRVEVEVSSLEAMEEAIAAGADVVLLDNMTPELQAAAVQANAGRVLLEASGGITLENVRAVASTGVNLISMGALTHSAPALDISLEVLA